MDGALSWNRPTHGKETKRIVQTTYEYLKQSWNNKVQYTLLVSISLTQ